MSNPPSRNRRIIERRKHPRIFTPMGVLFSFTRLISPARFEKHAEGDGILIDLSFEGCRLLSDIPLEISERYHLILQFPKISRPLIVEESIVRWTQENTYGLTFTSMQSIHESHLRELLRELRRPAP